MKLSEEELMELELSELQAAVDWGDEHGWDCPYEEQADLLRLFAAKVQYAQLTQNVKGADLAALKERLDDVNQEILADESAGKQWAENVEIKLHPINSDIVDRVEDHYGSPQGYNGVQAYARHNLTNYERLLDQSRDYLGPVHETIRIRVDQMIEDALARLGMDELSFCDTDESNSQER